MAKQQKTKLSQLNILLGVTGGIAAYKAVDLAGKLTAAGANVRTVMTENACRFVGAKSFEAVTNSCVYTSMWAQTGRYEIDHINLAEQSDIIVIAPATANIIAKAANGICDDLLSTILCACRRKSVLLAPAMNNNMWENPAVQRNIAALAESGFQITGPQKGRLACGTEAIGRMSEPLQIIKAIEQLASKIKRHKK